MHRHSLCAFAVTFAFILTAVPVLAEDPPKRLGKDELREIASPIYEEATGNPLHDTPCIAQLVDGVIVVGTFAHDRGCRAMGGVVKDSWYDSVDDFRDEALAHADWKNMGEEGRKQIVKQLTRLTIMGGSAVTSRKPAWDLDGAPEFHEPTLELEEDGGITYTFWLRWTAGRTTKRNLSRIEISVSADGDFSEKTLERWEYDRQEIERMKGPPGFE